MKKIFLLLNLLIVSFVQAQSHEPLLFAGNSNRPLAEKIADYLNISLGSAIVSKFNDGEINIQVKENVRKRDVFVIQSICVSSEQSVNDSLMELYLLVRTLRRASAQSITVVMPYYGYARQDRKTKPRVPISAADVAFMLEHAGVDRVVTIDLHCGQIQGFFHDAPVDNLYASPLFTNYFVNKDLHNVVVVSPDAGGVERAKKFLERLGRHGVNADMALISKQREQAGVVGSMRLIGDVTDADVIIVDDLCDTGGTLVRAAQLLKESGARRVYAAITHPVFSGKALEAIGNSVIEEMVIADTIPLRGQIASNIHIVSMAPLLGEAIRCIQEGKSISALFE